MYDVVVIGAGVSGCASARELSRYNLKVCVVEMEEDVCCGTSKANSAIVHAGFDAPNGSLKAKLNVEGSQMMPALAKELDIAVCDCYQQWKELSKTQDITQLLANRINHPTREMHELFAENLFKVIFDEDVQMAEDTSTMYEKLQGGR